MEGFETENIHFESETILNLMAATLLKKSLDRSNKRLEK